MAQRTAHRRHHALDTDLADDKLGHLNAEGVPDLIEEQIVAELLRLNGPAEVVA